LSNKTAIYGVLCISYAVAPSAYFFVYNTRIMLAKTHKRVFVFSMFENLVLSSKKRIVGAKTLLAHN